MQRRNSRKKPSLRPISRAPLRLFKVFVHHKPPHASRPLLLCVEIGLPADQEPPKDVVQAAALASKAKLGDTREFAASDTGGGQIRLGEKVLFGVAVGKYDGLGAAGTVCQLPLVVGLGSSA